MTTTRVSLNAAVAALVLLLVTVAAAPPAQAAHDTVLCMSRTVDNANNPINERKARPGAPVRVWGGAGTGGTLGIGDDSAAGEMYSWSFTCNDALTTVSDDGSLSGGVNAANDHYIVETVSFTLNGGATQDICTGTLDVGGIQCSVDIEITATTHPLTNLQQQDIDRQIAVEEGLLRLYLTQNMTAPPTNGDGRWPGNPYGPEGICAATGFSIWAMHINQHMPTGALNVIPGDIYTKTVEDGRNYLFSTEMVMGTFAQNATAAREALADQVSDCNANAQSVRLCKNDNFSWGYSHAIAAVGILTSNDPAVTSRVEDYVDLSGFAQTIGGSGRGGWNYTGPNASRGDGSIDAWQIRLVEGAEICYTPCEAAAPGGGAPDWILTEFEYESVSHQTNAAGPQPFGYTSAAPLIFGEGHATTAAGLTGLVAIELENSAAATPPGSTVIAAQPAPLNTIQAKRDAGLDYLGQKWGNVANNQFLGRGNRGNFYSMGSICVANRLSELVGWHSVHPNGFLINPATNQLFDWETGELGVGTDNIAPINTHEEGYITFLNRTQQADGRWDQGTYLGTFIETPLALICETTEQVLCPQETELGCNCDGRTQGYWHRQCLGVPASEGGIDPGRNGRGPSSPTEPNFQPELMDCADAALEDLGFFGVQTCEGMDADPANDPCEKALKQLTALILNNCSDKLGAGCSVDVAAEGCVSTNLGDLVQELADLINGGDCQTAKDCAAAVNEASEEQTDVLPQCLDQPEALRSFDFGESPRDPELDGSRSGKPGGRTRR